MIAAYLRVSTRKEQNSALQRNDILKYLAFHGIDSTNITFYDESGFSGDSSVRTELAKLMKDIDGGRIQTIIVWKLDRLFRSLRHLKNTLHHFEERGVKFISVKDNIDLSTPAGQLMLNLLGSFAEFEVSLIRERVRAGMMNAKEHGTRSGKPIGRPLETNVVEVKRLRGMHLSYMEIANRLGISKGAVARAIKAA